MNLKAAKGQTEQIIVLAETPPSRWPRLFLRHWPERLHCQQPVLVLVIALLFPELLNAITWRIFRTAVRASSCGCVHRPPTSDRLR
jgi:hypothetical protein